MSAGPLWCCLSGWSIPCSARSSVRLAPHWEVLWRAPAVALLYRGIELQASTYSLRVKHNACFLPGPAQEALSSWVLQLLAGMRIMQVWTNNVASPCRRCRLGCNALQHIRPQPIHPDGGVLRLDSHWGYRVTQGAHQACMNVDQIMCRTSKAFLPNICGCAS